MASAACRSGVDVGENLYSYISTKSKEAADALKHELEGGRAKPKTLTPEEVERASREYSHRSRAMGGFGGRASVAEPSARAVWESERSSVRDSVRLSIRDDSITEEISTHPSGSTITDEPVDDTLVKMSRDALDEAHAAAGKVHDCHERLAELLGQKEEHSTTLDELQRVRRSSAHERDSQRRSRQEQAAKQDTSWTWVRTFFRPAGKTFEEVARMQADCMQARRDAKEALGLLADIEQRLHRLGFAFALDAPEDQWEEASTKELPLPLGGPAGDAFPQRATRSNPSSSSSIGALTEQLTKASSRASAGRVTGNWQPRESSVSLSLKSEDESIVRSQCVNEFDFYTSNVSAAGPSEMPPEGSIIHGLSEARQSLPPKMAHARAAASAQGDDDGHHGAGRASWDHAGARHAPRSSAARAREGRTGAAARIFSLTSALKQSSAPPEERPKVVRSEYGSRRLLLSPRPTEP